MWWRRGDGSGLVLERVVIKERAWPKGAKKVRAAAFPGHRWPHDTMWPEWCMVTARIDGRLVGFVLLRDYDDGYVDLNDLAVHPDFQRRGIGQAVCDDAVDWMRDLGFARIVGMAISARSVNIFAGLGFGPGSFGSELIL